MIGVLLRAKWRTIANYRRSDSGGWRRLLAFLILGLMVWGGVLWASHWFIAKAAAIEPIGIVMVRKLLGLVLMFVFSILVVSNLIAAFSTLFLADDLQLVVAQPVGSYSLYAARWAENCVYASWMTVTFSVPFFLAVGIALGGSAAYYATLSVVLAVMGTMPGTLAIILALILGRFLSARRTRQLLMFVATFVFLVLFLLFRNLEPERFVDPDQRAPLLEVLGRIQQADAAWLPSSWATGALWQHLEPATEPATGLPTTLLVCSALALFFIGGWTFRKVFLIAYSRAQEGLHRVDVRRTVTRAQRPLAVLIERAQRRGGKGTILRAIVAKDVRVFFRDTAQWSQLLLLLALIAIYVVNFRYIRTAGESGLLTATGLHFINLALGGFVAVAICVRFAFPAVSLEGRAFWVILASPNSMAAFLRSKWRSVAGALAPAMAGLVAVTNIWLGAPMILTGMAIAVILPLTMGLGGLALGLGARYPRFGIDNAAKIATGFGGVLYMLLGLVLLAMVLAAVAHPTLTARFVAETGTWPQTRRIVISAALGLVSVALPVVIGIWAMRVGARHLQRHGPGA